MRHFTFELTLYGRKFDTEYGHESAQFSVSAHDLNDAYKQVVGEVRSKKIRVVSDGLFELVEVGQILICKVSESFDVYDLDMMGVLKQRTILY
jgi:hypothetical protein